MGEVVVGQRDGEHVAIEVMGRERPPGLTRATEFG